VTPSQMQGSAGILPAAHWTVRPRSHNAGALPLNGSRRIDRASRAASYEALVARAQACRLCPRMEGRRRVLGPGNGSLDARVLFVAEAPGRLGGDRTGVPLLSDQSGRNFGRLLEGIGWRRGDVFVSNAVLCNPRDAGGRNDTPTATEIRNCSAYLRDLLAILDPPYVVALGRTALSALALIAPHKADLRRHVATALPWAGRTLVPLYHPGPRAHLHRTFAQQQEDFARLRTIVRR
jgi:uracil-DNA glycosylase family 4